MRPINRSEILYYSRKYALIEAKRAKKGPERPKTEFGAQNQHDRVIYPSIGNLTWMKKMYAFRGQKGNNKLSES
jgi:hypothetical protein